MSLATFVFRAICRLSRIEPYRPHRSAAPYRGPKEKRSAEIRVYVAGSMGEGER